MSRLFQAIGQHALGMVDGPTIGKQVFESFVVCVQSQEKVSDIRPGLNAMPFRTGENRV